ncbi:MAG: NAD(P)/FAD-dependent oxidoreductase [Candidatus Hydrogenedentes bacterium]|nr:NAD(P)/FAD-dependent oxidoreductase [Candidatus Hydrogenedentota bacterium]
MSVEHHVVIVGGGFGGLNAAIALRRAPMRVTLVDKRNFHLFQPLLYQVATGALSPANIASPLRGVLKRQRNTTVILEEVIAFDPANRLLHFKDGTRISYDTLIVAAGVGHSYFGNEAWEELAPGLKSIEEATEIRRRFLLAFEEAERETDPERVKSLLTFVIVGAGPTGVELAGAIKEVAVHTLFDNFRTIKPSDARVILVEHNERVLPPFPHDLSQKALESLERLGVQVKLGTLVVGIRPGEVELRCGEESETIKAQTVLWAAGVGATQVARELAQATGAKTDRGGRITVERDLSVNGHPEIFVIGDMAACADEDGNPLPGVAQVAIQQGKYVAKLVAGKLSGGTLPPFRYRDRGSMATIGRARAVAQISRLHVSGFIAWIMWLFIHLMYLVQFQNRVLVLMQWSWSYLSWNRSARLITGRQDLK